MEIVTGIKIRDILLDNQNWFKLFLKYPKLIRKAIIINVLKIIVCRTSFLGYHQYVCPTCNKSIKVPHSCKSRFCPSCGKKATDNWIKTSINAFPKTTYQHITFTISHKLWDFFWMNRYLLNKVSALAVNVIRSKARKQGYLPGIFTSLHTFGRDLKSNIHIHLSTTVGGLSLSRDSWVKGSYFYHDTLKEMWKYAIISLLQNEFKAGRLKLPPYLRYIKTASCFCSWMTPIFHKKWNVFLQKTSDNLKANIEYLGKYLKRPPIGEPSASSRLNSWVEML